MNSLDLVELTPMGMPIEMLVSFTEIWNDKPLSRQILEVIKIAKIPDKNTAGSISPDRPQRNATVKTANPNADPNAAKFPKSAEPVDLS